MKDWLKRARSWPLRMILSSLRARLRGYWQYYCVISNSTMTWRYHAQVMRLVYKWLNRRSQRQSYGWNQFSAVMGKGVADTSATVCGKPSKDGPERIE